MQKHEDATTNEQHKFTERQIFTTHSDTPIETLKRQFERGKLDLQPSFQRNYVWDIQKASRLIESVLLNVPLPVIYLSEELDGKISVIDGQQRLTSFFAFISERFPIKNTVFKLNKLEVLTELNGKTFKELSDEQQEEILRYPLRVITFKKESPEDLKFEIFERLNSGSVQLKPQELRNCIYHGTLNDLIKKLIENPDFQFLMNLTDNQKIRMEDCEYVLRFISFYYLGEAKYPNSMKQFLNEMAKIGQNLSEEKLKDIENAFKNAFQISRNILGRQAFERFNKHTGWSGTFNAALYDTVLCGFTKRNKNSLMRHADEIREALIELMSNDEAFIETILGSTSSKKFIKRRLKTWNDTLDQILANDDDEPRRFSLKLKQELFDTDPTCKICGNKIQDLDNAAIDHIQQYWQGGRTIPENARLTHRFCNNSRSRKT